MAKKRTLEIIRKAKYVTIGELVRLSGLRYSTLKYYTEEGLLPFEQAEENLRRRYRREASLSRLETIKKWKSKGYSIVMIKAKLGLTGNTNEDKNAPKIVGARKSQESETTQELGGALVLK